MSEDLKPCPWCGCAMKLESYTVKRGYGKRAFFRPVATGSHKGHAGFCHGEDTATGSASVEAALARWNTRNTKEVS